MSSYAHKTNILSQKNTKASGLPLVNQWQMNVMLPAVAVGFMFSSFLIGLALAILAYVLFLNIKQELLIVRIYHFLQTAILIRLGKASVVEITGWESVVKTQTNQSATTIVYDGPGMSIVSGGE